MKQKECVLPEKCNACGAVFDLWYDLLKKRGNVAGVGGFGESEDSGYGYADEFLCWKCRELSKEAEEEESIIELDGEEIKEI